MNAPTFEQLDEMAKAIRARLLGRDDEWAVIDEAARMAYRLAALDAWAIAFDAGVEAGMSAMEEAIASPEMAERFAEKIAAGLTGLAQSKQCAETSPPTRDDE